jgi:23S rRNA pseudouridine1911/1915/1917 synthase
VFEDAAVLVLEKPAGLVVHPARGHWEGTLVHGLVALSSFDRSEASSGGDLERPGIVHRLDKGTSGLLVVAKTPAAREALKAQFAAHTIDREYVAIVVGNAKDATIDAPHGRHPRDRMRFTSFGRPIAAKRAVTHVRVLEPLRGATLVACTLETGRTHQIRVQLAERMRTPVLGDPIYGTKPNDPTLARVATDLGRQALHARLLGFRHPVTGQPMRFESRIPDDIVRALRALTKPSI